MHSTVPRLAIVIAMLAVVPASAIEWTAFDGTARGYPVLREVSGRKIGDGDFVQWVERGRLNVRITYSGGGRRIEEISVFRQNPELIQEQWSIRELRSGKLFRQFAIDFDKGVVTAKKLDEGEMKQWSDTVEVDRGRAFAGFGFSLAARMLHKRLVAGEQVSLQTIGFTPKPRKVTVKIAYSGVDRIRMGDRTINGERFVVHAEVPFIAKLFVKVPDAQIWLTTPAPPTFLRFEGPLAEPSDPVMRVDLMPGEPSDAAVPVATSGRK
jgi:hypothetical protein